MRVLLCVLLFILSEVKESKSLHDDETPSLLQRRVDILPERFHEPVPFGHITIEGVADPQSPIKQPIDFLELDMLAPKNQEEAIKMLKKGRKNISFMKGTIPNTYASPRDMYLRDIVQPRPDTNTTKLKWYNIAELQLRNAMMPGFTARQSPRRNGPHRPRPPMRVEPKISHFSKNSFELKSDQAIKKVNWTTCDQFAVGAVFSPKDIVGISWTPFYIWSLAGYAYAIVHKFTYPTNKLVQEYRLKFGKYLNKTIDWNKPKLLLNGMNEMLLIAVDKKGLFDAIIKHEIPDGAKDAPITLPSLTIRLKIEDPYLVMMYCEDYYAAVMAISGREPIKYKDMKAEASTINFVGSGRPVWRDYAAEEEKKKLENAEKTAAKEDDYIRIETPYEPVVQYD